MLLLNYKRSKTVFPPSDPDGNNTFDGRAKGRNFLPFSLCHDPFEQKMIGLNKKMIRLNKNPSRLFFCWLLDTDYGSGADFDLLFTIYGRSVRDEQTGMGETGLETKRQGIPTELTQISFSQWLLFFWKSRRQYARSTDSLYETLPTSLTGSTQQTGGALSVAVLDGFAYFFSFQQIFVTFVAEWCNCSSVFCSNWTVLDWTIIVIILLSTNVHCIHVYIVIVVI